MVNSCCNYNKTDVKYSIYGLPNNSEKRASWLKIIGVTEEFLIIRKKKKYYVCHLHFDDGDFEKKDY